MLLNDHMIFKSMRVYTVSQKMVPP